MTKQEEIIEKLKFTVAMCEYDPLTGDIIERCFMNDMTRTTYDACKAAIEIIEKHHYVHDKCKKCIEFSEFKQQPCEDCISREQTLKAFAEKCGGECACCEYNGSGYDNAENCKLIKSMPSVTPQPTRWIPVTERLPEDNIHVLCQFTLSGMGECYLAHGVFHVVGGVVMTCNEVIAWMPLPEPYKAESEESE